MNNNVPKTIKNFLSYMSSIRGATKSTIKAYEYDLVLFFKYLRILNNEINENTPFEEIEIHMIDNEYIKGIDLSDVYSFLSYLEIDRSNASTTRARKIACLKSFFTFLYRKNRLIPFNISEELEIPKLQKRLPIYLTERESRHLINSVAGRNELRNRTIIILFLNTGMRLSELCSINISSIREDTINIIGKGNKERIVYLNDYSLRVLKEYMEYRLSLKVDTDALFLSEQKKRISKRTVEYLVNRSVVKAGLSEDYSVHKLRHSAATLMFRAGTDIRSIQKILGHETIATTQIYTHVSDEQLREAVKNNPLNW